MVAPSPEFPFSVDPPEESVILRQPVSILFRTGLWQVGCLIQQLMDHAYADANFTFLTLFIHFEVTSETVEEKFIQ